MWCETASERDIMCDGFIVFQNLIKFVFQLAELKKKVHSYLKNTQPFLLELSFQTESCTEHRIASVFRPERKMCKSCEFIQCK